MYLEELKTMSLANPECVVTWLESLRGKNVKWKHSVNANQIVFRTDDYYYKVYAFDEVDKFSSLIRHAFSEVYRSYGIDWEIITVQTDKGFLDIERREILEVCKEWYDEILINYSNTLNLVEDKLCFSDIVNQIQSQYKFASKLKLMRNCVNTQSDYAIYNDKIILLDDADWFLYILDDENKPISTHNMFIKINLLNEYYTFTHQIINPQRNLTLECVYERTDKFFLFKRLDIITRASSLKNDFQKMLANNISLLTLNDNNISVIEEESSMYSPFKKIFYCSTTLEGINYFIYNKIAIRQSDIKKNKTLWDDICYEYVSKNICGIHLYTSFYDVYIDELCELLNQAKLFGIEPVYKHTHTGLTLYIQWNIIKDNELWEENFNYIQQHYPEVKIVVNVVLNEPFLQKVFCKDINIKTFKFDCGAKILYGTCDDTPREFLPRRKSMLRFISNNEYIIDSEISYRVYSAETNFENDNKPCGCSKQLALPYYDSDKCCVCDYKALMSM